MKKIGNLYELINDALDEGFEFFMGKDLNMVKLEDKLDELVGEYGESLTEGLWTATDRKICGTSVFRHLDPEDEKQERYMLIKF